MGHVESTHTTRSRLIHATCAAPVRTQVRMQGCGGGQHGIRRSESLTAQARTVMPIMLQPRCRYRHLHLTPQTEVEPRVKHLNCPRTRHTSVPSQVASSPWHAYVLPVNMAVTMARSCPGADAGCGGRVHTWALVLSLTVLPGPRRARSAARWTPSHSAECRAGSTSVQHTP